MISWGSAVSSNDGVLALIYRFSNSGSSVSSVSKLNAMGHLIEESKPLPLDHPVQKGCVALPTGGRALIVAPDRKEERFVSDGGECCFMYDQPRWFACSWKGRLLEPEQIGFWQSMAAGDFMAQSGDETVTWTMRQTVYEREPQVCARAYLAFGFATGARLPDMHSTETPCTEAAHVMESAESILALVNSGFKELRLYRLAATGETSQLSVICPQEHRKGEVSEPAILPLADGYVFLWRYYNKKIKRSTRDGGIWFRTCDRGLREFGEPQRLSADREICAGRWLASDLNDSGMVVWANGPSRSKEQVRFVRVRARSELPLEPRAYRGILPDRVLATDAGVLALSTVFSQQPYCFRLMASRLDDLQ